MAAAYAVLCPGQGAQSPEMFDMANADPRGHDVLAEFSQALGFDLTARAQAGHGLFDNALAQPAMVAAARSSWAMLAPHLPPPFLFAGYSVGELSAWCCAVEWDAASAANIATARAGLMDRCSPPGCGMLAVRGMNEKALLPRAQGLFVAIVNELDHFVLAGPDAALEATRHQLETQGIWARRLDVHVPSHTPLMQAAAAGFREVMAGVAIGPLKAPVLRGIDGSICRSSQAAGDALARAICEPIRWADCMQTLVEAGVRAVLELGPGRSLVKLFNDAHPQVAARSLADFRSRDGVIAWLKTQTSA